MKKILHILPLMIAALMAGAFSAQARSRFSFGVYLGGYPSPYDYRPYPYYYPYYAPPVVIRQPSEIYVQQVPRPAKPRYWYFCKEANGYYPYVKRCPGGWMKVVPEANPPEATLWSADNQCSEKQE